MELKKIGLAILMVLGLSSGVFAAAVGGYRLFTVVQHYNVVEGVEAQYWDGDSWETLAVDGSQIDLPAQTVMAGETKSLVLRARNTATSGALNLEFTMETVAGLTNDFVCIAGQSDGVNYTEELNEYDVYTPFGGAWKIFQIDTSLAGDIATGSYEFDNTLKRNTALGSYANTCGAV